MVEDRDLQAVVQLVRQPLFEPVGAGKVVVGEPGDDPGVTPGQVAGRQRRADVGVVDDVTQMFERYGEQPMRRAGGEPRLLGAVLHDQHAARNRFDRAQAQPVAAADRHPGHQSRARNLLGDPARFGPPTG